MKTVLMIALLFAASTSAQGQYGTAPAQTYSPNSGPDYPVPQTYPVPDRRESYDPNAPGAYENQARQSFAEGDSAGAEFNFAKALEVNPFDPAALNNLAVVKTEQGDYFAAVDLLQRAARLQPNNPEIAANLARLRSWVQTYAITPQNPDGVLPGPNDPDAQKIAAAYDRTLPPAPPALWQPRDKPLRY